MSSAVTGMVVSDLPHSPGGRAATTTTLAPSRGKIGAVSLLARRRYPEVVERPSTGPRCGTLVDGDRSRLNLAHECVDRWVDRGTALRLQFADGRREEWSFADLAAWSAASRNFLERHGVRRGDRVALLLEPSLPFYGALFGTLKRGAVAVPLFTLFGPDALGAAPGGFRRARAARRAPTPTRRRSAFPGVDVLRLDDALAGAADREPDRLSRSTPSPDDLAVLQYTSGTTRALPEAVAHTHRAVVTLMIAALYGVGLDRRRSLLLPVIAGVGPRPRRTARSARSRSGSRWVPTPGASTRCRLREALAAFRITNLAAAPTVYRLLRESGLSGPRRAGARPR